MQVRAAEALLSSLFTRGDVGMWNGTSLLRGGVGRSRAFRGPAAREGGWRARFAVGRAPALYNVAPCSAVGWAGSSIVVFKKTRAGVTCAAHTSATKKRVPLRHLTVCHGLHICRPAGGRASRKRAGRRPARCGGPAASLTVHTYVYAYLQAARPRLWRGPRTTAKQYGHRGPAARAGPARRREQNGAGRRKSARGAPWARPVLRPV